MRPICLDTYSFHFASDVWEPHLDEPRDVLWIADQAIAMGFDGLHTADMGHFNKAITPDLLAQHLKNGSLSLGTGGCGPDHMREMIETAQCLGHALFRTFLNRGATGEKINALREVMPLAEEAKVKIAIENHMDLTCAELLRVLQQVDSSHLGICLDFGNGLGTHENPLEVCEKLAPYVITTHIKDYAIAPAGAGYVFWSVPLGTGCCRVSEQLEILFKHSPVGNALPLNLESALEHVDFSMHDAAHLLDHLTPVEPAPPSGFEGWTPKRILAEEEKLIRTSLANLRTMMA